MENFKEVLDGLQKSVKSLQEQMVSIRAGEVPATGAKLPGERSSPVQQVGDEVPTWAERMELETETLTLSGDEIRPVKVREETELVLQNAFTPLKNPDRRALRRQFLVPDMPLTMAPKLDKVMAAECVPCSCQDFRPVPGTPAGVNVGRGGYPHTPSGEDQRVQSQ